MLEFLITSATRRALLLMLWGEGMEESAHGLAKAGSLSYAPTYRELNRMLEANLVTVTGHGAGTTFKRNPDHPQAGLLRQLFGVHPAPADAAEANAQIKVWLSNLGAPLIATGSPNGMPPPEEVFARGLVLAHRDSSVARAMPVLLWQWRNRFEFTRLKRAAVRLRVKDTLGFYLDLTAELGRDAALREHARGLRDRRRKKVKPFFAHAVGPRALAMAEINTPAKAREWLFSMNMQLESFAQLFEKFCP